MDLLVLANIFALVEGSRIGEVVCEPSTTTFLGEGPSMGQFEMD